MEYLLKALPIAIPVILVILIFLCSISPVLQYGEDFQP